MSIDDDLTRLALQEERLQFESFNAATALDLGLRIKAIIEKLGKTAAIDIGLHGHTLFFYAMPGTAPDKGDWTRRKRNVVMRFHRSSYAFSLGMEKNGYGLTERYGMSVADYALAGGGFPIILRGTGCVGSIAVSGLPQRDDHGVIVQALADLLGQDVAELALPAE